MSIIRKSVINSKCLLIFIPNEQQLSENHVDIRYTYMNNKRNFAGFNYKTLKKEKHMYFF